MFNVIHKLESGDQQSSFSTNQEMLNHKLTYPEMWEPNCETVVTDVSGQVIEKSQLEKRKLKREYCMKALDLIATHNELNETDPAIQAVFSAPQFSQMVILLLSGTPKAAKNILLSIANNPYPTDLMDKVVSALDTAISYSNVAV